MLTSANCNLLFPAKSNAMNLISALATQKANAVASEENKNIVFGIHKRNGKVYTEIVRNVKAKTLQ